MARAASSCESFRFADALEVEAAQEVLGKAERTRRRLLAALARLLSKPGVEPGDLRVADITGEAGVALGTFYRYFPERAAALKVLLADFVRFVEARMAGARQGLPGSRARVFSATLAYVRLFRDNQGLMRCLLGLDRESAAWAMNFRTLNRAWNGRVALALAGQDAKRAADYLPAAYALGGMVDEFLTQLYLRRVASLAKLRRDEGAVAALLADLWWRAARPPAKVAAAD